MEHAVVTSLLGIVEQQLLLLKSPHPRLILGDDTKIILKSLVNKLGFLRAYLEESDPEAPKHLKEGIGDVAAEAEDKIESKLSEVYLAADKGDNDKCAIEAACEDLHQILQQVVKDFESAEVRIRDLQIRRRHSDTASSTPPLQQIADIHIRDRDCDFSEDYMIGFEDEFEKIKAAFIYNRREYLQVISIVGMGGLGKTTLARKVYEDPSVLSHFDVRAWITVSQEFSKRQLLIDLLRCIVSLTSEISEKSDDQLAEQLLKTLTGVRYFIVIDDIWKTEAWDYIRRFLPDNNTGSRVLVTTRMREVAEYASSSDAFSSHLRFLNPDESWNLFVRKVFKGGVCQPPELESIGRKIIEKYTGSPLQIVVIAGLVARLERSPKQWEDFAQRLNSESMGMGFDPASEILALSYKYLPAHLRACFLYLGIFPEDSHIHVKKLIKLWVAEGFLESSMHNSLEEVAMEYLDDLIARNLVLVVKRSFDGEVKSCTLHDVLREFCLRKAQEENMVVVINEYRDDLAATEQSSKQGCRWLSCESRHWPITPSTSLNYDNWGKIRSILYFGKDLYLAKCRLEFPCLKLLRVLDLSFIKYWNGMPSEIVDLIHLRYLALTTTGSLCNIQLLKLQNLQTLILFSWKEECHLHLPCVILDLPLLRHVHLDRGTSLYLPNSVQENLQTLFWLKVSSWDSKTLDFTRVPNLKELGIYFEGEVSADALDSLVQLHQLEKLKFEMGRVERFNLPISFPPNIKKLTLCNTYLPWEDMDVISTLPNLVVLKLKDFAFCGSRWELREEECLFPRLKLLLIAHSDLEHWIASADHFPNLECLVLRCCWYLKELPDDFEEIFTLQLIELIDCCPSLVDSAMNIREVMLDCGNDCLDVRHSLTEDKSAKDKSSEEENESEV